MSQTKAQLLDGKSATIQFTGGSVSAPSVSFTGDTNTGIYSPGADQVAISTGGSGRLFVDASGNVGVGTATPNTMSYGGGVLGIFGAGTLGGNIWLTSETTAAGNRTGRIGFGTEGNTVSKETARIWSLADGTTAGNLGGNLLFNTKADGGSLTERLRITSAGLVGVGTSSPSTTLSVAGGISGTAGANISGAGWGVLPYVANSLVIDNNAGEARFFATGANATTRGSFIFYNGETDGGAGAAMVIDSSGRVGVGTTSPSATLHVLDPGGGANGTIRFGSSTFYGQITHEASITGANIYNSQDSGGHIFQRNGTELMRLDSSGRVGIGTSAPGTNLDIVVGSGTATQKLGSSSVSGGSYLNLHGASASKTWFIGANYNVAGALEFIQSTANGGTTPSSTPAMTLDSSGRLGIGTTSPSGKLTVKTSTSNGSPTTWGDGQLVVSTGDTSTSLGIALSVNSVDNTGSLTCLTPGTAWRAINYRASEHIFYRTDASVNESARIDSSGRLLVGTSSARTNFFNSTATARFQVEGVSDGDIAASIISSQASVSGPQLLLGHQRSGSIGGNTVLQYVNGTTSDDQLGLISFQGSDGTEFVEGARIQAYVDGTPGANDMPGRLVFSTTADGASSPTERMRITQVGGVKVSTNGSYAILGAASSHEFVQSNQGVAAFHAYHSASSGIPYGFYFKFTNLNPNDTTSYVFTSVDNTNANIYTINSNGTVTARSDAKFKKNIETARNGYLEDLAQLRVVKYNWYNHEDNTPKELGFIAQEVEQVFPGLVSTAPDKDDQGNETGEVSKSIKTSVFTPMLVKALQEALKRIETLEAEVAALKAL